MKLFMLRVGDLTGFFCLILLLFIEIYSTLDAVQVLEPFLDQGVCILECPTIEIIRQKEAICMRGHDLKRKWTSD